MSASIPRALPERAWRDDARTIALIGLAHGTSHFFHLLLPPLFPWFVAEFGLSYVQTGLLVSVFFTVSGLGQALAGFVVDRVGARPVLFAALSCFVLAALTAAGAQGLGGLVAAAALAGLGNAPFHPVDFTILNRRVAAARLGHAYSVHGISGNLGWAAAPVFLTGLTVAWDSWRWALLAAALWAVIVIAVLALQRQALVDRLPRPAGPIAAPVPEPGGPARDSALAFLSLPAVWLSFAFFFWSTCALAAIQSFAGPALHWLYGLPLALTPLVVTGYMLSGAVGMVIGGFWVTRARHLERVISLALLTAAAMLCIVGLRWLPGTHSGYWALALTALAGFGAGLAGPSRDMLIKQAAPAQATGRVYGLVYSGLDLGFAVSAPIFGALLDQQRPAWVFVGAALTLVVGVGCATVVGRLSRTPAGPASA